MQTSNKHEEVIQEENKLESLFSQELINKFIFECIMNKYKPTTAEDCEYVIKSKRIHSRIIEHKGIQLLTICAKKNIIL